METTVVYWGYIRDEGQAQDFESAGHVWGNGR